MWGGSWRLSVQHLRKDPVREFGRGFRVDCYLWTADSKTSAKVESGRVSNSGDSEFDLSFLRLR
jgi:hypothetical protein